MMLGNTGMNLSKLDLNLFVVLHVVLEERSATLAAKRLHVTQSAVSNAISRLRAALGDPLVVRSGRGLTPTPRAEELAAFRAQAAARGAAPREQRLPRRDRRAGDRRRGRGVCPLGHADAGLARAIHLRGARMPGRAA